MIVDMVEDFVDLSRSIFFRYDGLYNDHIISKAQNRTLMIQNDMLRNEIAYLRGEPEEPVNKS